MKIDKKLLSIPPYISSSWENISSLHVEEKEGRMILIVLMNNGSRIEIPNLDEGILSRIFTAHRQHLEIDSQPQKESKGDRLEFALPFKGGLDTLENMGNVLQHNPQQSDTPDLPEEMIKKIASIAKAVGVDDETLAPKPEPHCNCPHCQIARAIHSGFDHNEEVLTTTQESDEEVTDEDLRFRNWDVKQTGDHLYLVTNLLDNDEQYHVFLGKPIGCNCGMKNCEHIKAVLQS